MSDDCLTAGRELDARVAMNVMGWRPHIRNTAHWTDAESVSATDYRVRGIVDEWSPSTFISAAWEVVGLMRESGWIVRVQEMPDRIPFLSGSGWRPEENQPINRRAACWFYPTPELVAQMVGKYLNTITKFGDTAPLAICRAALAAIESTTT